MAQVLSYVSTKAMAARLMLKTGKSEAADSHLLQLEKATRGLFVDVRQAVLGLRAAGDIGGCLGATLQDFAVQFSQLSDIPVEVHIAPEAEDLDLPAETELQLLRIMQEALTNVRKHAAARKAAVNLQVIDGALTLAITDDGVGFDSDCSRSKIQHQFGLSTMQERAEAIDAEFELESAPGAGTHIKVRLPT